MDTILNIEEVAEFLRVSDRTVRRLLAANEIPAFKVGGTWRFRQEDLTAWIEERISKGKEDLRELDSAS